MSLRVIESIDLNGFLTAILHSVDDVPPDILDQVCWLNYQLCKHDVIPKQNSEQLRQTIVNIAQRGLAYQHKQSF